MATEQSTVDYILEQTRTAGLVHARKMFGEYALYCDEKVVALICDDQLYIKPTDPGKAFAAECPEAPPYPNAKPHLHILGDLWDNHEWLTELISLTAAELPLPKKKPKKTKDTM